MIEQKVDNRVLHLWSCTSCTGPSTTAVMGVYDYKEIGTPVCAGCGDDMEPVDDTKEEES